MRTILWIGIGICILLIMFQAFKKVLELTIDILMAMIIYSMTEEAEKGNHSVEFLNELKEFLKNSVDIHLSGDNYDKNKIIEIWRDIRSDGNPYKNAQKKEDKR